MPQPIPAGYHTITPTLTVNDAPKAIEFYKRALGAIEESRALSPDGKVMHAAIKIGDSKVYVNDEIMGAKSPKSIGGSPAAFYLYVDDADRWFKRAVDAGGRAVMPPSDMFWGDRYGRVADPFGYEWSFATHKEDVAPDEMERRQKQMFASMGQGQRSA
jgi:PhnB protein